MYGRLPSSLLNARAANCGPFGTGVGACAGGRPARPPCFNFLSRPCNAWGFCGGAMPPGWPKIRADQGAGGAGQSGSAPSVMSCCSGGLVGVPDVLDLPALGYRVMESTAADLATHVVLGREESE